MTRGLGARKRRETLWLSVYGSFGQYGSRVSASPESLNQVTQA